LKPKVFLLRRNYSLLQNQELIIFIGKKYEYWRREKWGKFRWSENELSPLWQQIVEATSYGDGMTEMENDGESQLVKLYILDATYNACRSLSHWYD